MLTSKLTSKLTGKMTQMLTKSSQIEGISKMFIPTFISGALNHVLASGTPLNIPTPPAGQHVMLYALGSLVNLSNVSVNSDGSPIIDGKKLTLFDSDAVGEFHISTSVTNSSGQQGQIPELLFAKNAIASVTVPSGTGTLLYTYAHGILV